MRAKKPAIRKNVVIRKTWMVKDSKPRIRLGWVSWMIQNRGDAGTNDNVACRTMPSSRARALTASSACRRSGAAGATVVKGDMDGLGLLEKSFFPASSLLDCLRPLLPNPKIG